MNEIKIVAGLGNPGASYANTRHNAGFRAVDRLAERWGVHWKKWEESALVSEKGPGNVFLVKPQTFMNRSGQPLRAIAEYYRVAPSEIIVVVDDFALPLGTVRPRKMGSAGGHNGLSSVIEHFATADIPRLRLGIGPLPPAVPSHDFVLAPFRPEEKEAVESMVTAAADTVERILSEGWEKAVSRLSTAVPKEEQE